MKAVLKKDLNTEKVNLYTNLEPSMKENSSLDSSMGKVR